MKKPSCKKDWDAARRIFPYDKELWPLPNVVVAEKLNVSLAFIQRLRVTHGIPFATRIDRMPPADILENENALVASNEFGCFRGHSNKSQPWLAAKFNVPISRIAVLQSEHKVITNPNLISARKSRTVAPKGCADLMKVMHTWICKPMVSQ